MSTSDQILTRLASNYDILSHIISFLPISNLPAVLRTSSLFFSVAAPALYRSIPISHTCNPFIGASAEEEDKSTWPYGKDALLERVIEVYLERGPVEEGEKLWHETTNVHPLSHVEQVAIQPHPNTFVPTFDHRQSPLHPLPTAGFIAHICRNASRLHFTCTGASRRLPADWYSAPGDLPPLPGVESMTVKLRVSRSRDAVSFLNACSAERENLYPTCQKINFYLWNDIIPNYNAFDDAVSRSMPVSPSLCQNSLVKWRPCCLRRGFGTADRLAIDTLLPQLARLVAERKEVKAVAWFNVDPILERFATINEKTLEETMLVKREMELSWISGRKAVFDGEEPTLPVPFTFHPAGEYYKTLWDDRWAPDDISPLPSPSSPSAAHHGLESEWHYHESILYPSSSLTHCRTKASRLTQVPMVCFLFLPQERLRYLLLNYTLDDVVYREMEREMEEGEGMDEWARKYFRNPENQMNVGY
ncbi:hypothetical protein B9479_006392 [Cryptococcus floricola]|uniref:F-box domain-containing protein n=1 Tax=Cryptococcus floricola TaxID=2591691 RepID=A0A5D3AS02_9TREE|nr:hypothetical protein B9479_006392 [Cryptococcus floricola]